MALTCPNCGGADVLAGIDRNNCVNCGAILDSEGKVTQGGLDEAGRTRLRDQADKTNAPGIVGNLADIQRIGAELAGETGGLADVIPPAPGFSTEQTAEIVDAHAEAVAAGDEPGEPGPKKKK